MPSTPRRAAIAVAAVLTAVTLVACSSGDGARNAVAVGGTFQFHSPGGQTEIIYAEEERAPLPDFSGPSLMEEGEEISLSDFEGEVSSSTLGASGVRRAGRKSMTCSLSRRLSTPSVARCWASTSVTTTRPSPRTSNSTTR